MAAHRLKPHQQAILDDFDAGERNAAELARKHSYAETGIRSLLRRFGRVTRTRAEANNASDRVAVLTAHNRSPEHRAATSARMKAVWAAAKGVVS